MAAQPKKARPTARRKPALKSVPVEQPIVSPPPKYKIIRGADMLDLADAVNASMESGWVPIGGVCHVQPGLMDLNAGSAPLTLYQALVKP